MNFLLIIISFLVLKCTPADQEQRLIGTWYAIDKGKIHSVTFRADKTFEFHVEGLDFNPVDLKNRNIDMTSDYEVVEGSPNRIYLTINLIHPDTTLSIDLNGIYELKDNSTLQLDFRPSIEPELQVFTNKSVSYKNSLNDLKTELPTEDKEGNYIFTYNKKDKLIQDTIRPNNPRYEGIELV